MRHSVLKKHLILITLLSMVTLPLRAGEVPLKVQSAILLKILGYDSSVSKSGAGTIVFHVVTDSKTGSRKNELLTGFKTINGASVGGKKVVVKTVSIGNAASSLANNQYNVLYVPFGSSDSTVKSASRLSVPVFAGNVDQLNSGAAVAIDLVNGKPKIVVNLKQSKAQGMQLSSQLLKLARVIK